MVSARLEACHPQEGANQVVGGQADDAVRLPKEPWVGRVRLSTDGAL
jgi:hypothetical protein